MGFIKYFREEAAIIKERDPAIKSKWEVLLYPSFWAVWKYRKAHKHYMKGHFFRARYISQRAARKTGIDSSRCADWQGIFYRPWSWSYHRRDNYYR